jgi:hypothetical protein
MATQTQHYNNAVAFSAIETEKKRLEACLADEAFRKAFTQFASDILQLEMCCDQPDFNRIAHWPTRRTMIHNRTDHGVSTDTGDIITTLFYATYYDGESDYHYGFSVEHCRYSDGTVQYDFQVIFHDDECDGESCTTYTCPSRYL